MNEPDYDAPDDSMMPEKDERQFSMFMHFSQFAGFVIPFGGIIAPLVMWQMKKEESQAIDSHGRMIMNAVISYTLYIIGAAILSIVLIGIPFLIAAAIMALVCPIIGGIKANDGVLWNYPLTIKFL